MNRYPDEAAPEEEEEAPPALPDPNADDDLVFAELEGPPSRPAGVEPSGSAPAPTPVVPDPAELTRQNELLKQRLAQEAQARQQQAAYEVQRWYNSLPEDKKAAAAQQIQAARLQGEAAQREEEDKRRVMWTIAQQNALEGSHLEEFYEVAQGMSDPYAMERLGKRYKHFMDTEKGTVAAPKEKPAMSRVRPDAGAPQGNRSSSLRKRQEEILAPFMGGGPKQGNLEELEMELERHGKYGRIA